MNRPPPGKAIVAQVPIVGQHKVWAVCPQGHAEQLPALFAQLLPDPKTSKATAVPCCRLCVMKWFAETFPVAALPPEEAERLEREIRTGETVLTDDGYTIKGEPGDVA